MQVTINGQVLRNDHKCRYFERCCIYNPEDRLKICSKRCGWYEPFVCDLEKDVTQSENLENE